jgi:hypothetical protein
MYCFQTHGDDSAFRRARLSSAQGLSYWVEEAANCFIAFCGCSCAVRAARLSVFRLLAGSHLVTQTKPNQNEFFWCF